MSLRLLHYDSSLNILESIYAGVGINGYRGFGSTALISGSSSTIKPWYDTSQIIDALTTRDGAQPSVAWEPDIISYSIDTGQIDSQNKEYTPEMDGYVSMTPVMQAVARAAFEMWDDLIAVDLVEQASWPDAHITFNYSTNTGGSTYTNYWYWQIDNQPRSDYRLSDADIWLDSSWPTQDQDSDLTLGSYGVLTYLHEIGHALGLTHPGDYNGAATYDADATHQQDTQQYTVMSYFRAGANGSDVDHSGTAGWSYGATPLLDDILAVQAVYGADMTTRTGDTVYGFNSTAGRAAFDFTVNTNPVVAIWDAGGVDRIDVSGWNTDQVVDLHAGSFSSVGYLTQNLAIAYGATIEQAVGGGGNDHLIGNAADNLLIGMAGADWLEGGPGSDTLQGGAGADTLDGQAGQDTADYANSGAGISINLNQGTASGGTAQGDVLISIENISGSSFDDFIVGDGNDNVLRGGGGNDALIDNIGNDILDGGAGNDFLTGHAGDDQLFGGAGNDVLRGGVGADLIDGGPGYDWLLYNSGTSAVKVDLSQNAGFSGEALGDVIVGIEHVIGTDFADTLTGDDNRNFLLGRGGADYLDGGAGNDVLKGMDGNDTLVGGPGKDVLIGGPGADTLIGGPDGDWASYIEATSGVGVDLRSGGFAGEAAGDTYDGIVHIWGSPYDDHLIGNDRSNLIRGDAGNDIIEGGHGKDVLIGGAGADVFVFNSGDGVDRVNGFSIGVDLVEIDSGAAQYSDLQMGSFDGWLTVTYDVGDTLVFTGLHETDANPDMFAFG